MLPLDPKKIPSDRSLARPEPAIGNGLPPALPAPWPGVVESAGPSLPPGMSSAPSMSALVQAFRRRWPLIAGVALVAGMLAAAGLWIALPGKFTAQTALELTSRTDSGYESEADVLSFRRAQLALFKSPEVLRDVLQRPEVAPLAEVREHGDNGVAWLQQAIKSDDKEGNNILLLKLSGENPEDLAVILNELTRCYLAKKQKEVKERIKKLQENRSSYGRDLDTKRRRLDDEARKHGLDNPLTLTARYEDARQDLRDLKKRRGDKAEELKKAEAEVNSLQARIDHPDKLRISELALEDEIKKEEEFKRLYQQVADLNVYIANAESISGKGSAPQETASRDSILKLIKAKRDKLRPEIEARLRSKQVLELKDKAILLESQIAGINAGNKVLDADIDAATVKVEQLRSSVRTPGKLPSILEPFNDEVLQIEGVLKKIDEKLSALQAENSNGTEGRTAKGPPEVAQVKVIYPAQAPKARDTSRQAKMAGMAGFGVFGVVLVFLVLLESRKRRVNTTDDIVQGLGINLLGTLPALPAHARRPVSGGAQPDPYWQNLMTESVDVIRTVLLHASRTESLRVVMVTSAESGEGKTSLASHLAASLARAWRKTLLIDADLRNPAAHLQFGIPLEPGFSELLRGEAEADDVVRPTPVSRLWLMPAGKWDTHAIQALAQEEVRTFFELLKKEYDFIIIDSSPVLPVADSLLIGQHVDAVLFSVMREVSRTPAVYAAQQRLAVLGVRMLGAVVIGEKNEPYGSASSRYLTCSPG